jgi:hypothetical protein
MITWRNWKSGYKGQNFSFSIFPKTGTDQENKKGQVDGGYRGLVNTKHGRHLNGSSTINLLVNHLKI